MDTALANFLERVGRASLDYAGELRRSDVEELTLEAPADPADQLSLGERQQQIVGVLSVTADDGLTTAEIASRMDNYDSANAHMSLRALQNRGVVEEVGGKSPIHWRLAHRYRATADPYLEMAEHVHHGEWTTYGDISIAVRGDNRAAIAVGRAAAALPNFPNPHRVLRRGGNIPPEWHATGSDTPTPEECRRLLEEEGVTFDEQGRADSGKYVAWGVLQERAGTAPDEAAA